ncbi:MAG: peroxidase-related enzyme [Terriglobales bacterium]
MNTRPATTKIKVVEDDDATGAVAEAYEYWRASSGRKKVPGIIKCLSARPDFLKQSVDFSNTLQFSEGHLSRRHKEMLGSYVSFLNDCPYCLDSHAFFLKTQGASEQTMHAFLAGDLDNAELTPAEQVLMRYAELVTRAAYRTTPEDVQELRDAGWKEEQIAEAAYIIALFNMFNRIANAFGVPVQNYVAMGRTTP